MTFDSNGKWFHKENVLHVGIPIQMLWLEWCGDRAYLHHINACIYYNRKLNVTAQRGEGGVCNWLSLISAAWVEPEMAGDRVNIWIIRGFSCSSGEDFFTSDTLARSWRSSEAELSLQLSHKTDILYDTSQTIRRVNIKIQDINIINNWMPDAQSSLIWINTN